MRTIKRIELVKVPQISSSDEEMVAKKIAEGKSLELSHGYLTIKPCGAAAGGIIVQLNEIPMTISSWSGARRTSSQMSYISFRNALVNMAGRGEIELRLVPAECVAGKDISLFGGECFGIVRNPGGTYHHGWRIPNAESIMLSA